ncbi:MAG: YlxR family protein [Pleurocapsa sp. MO_192.B19]|nr:YlxR family protein [Pleurocapsa sp. MO_192.B19]
MNQINYRRCISCRRVASKASFWRVVRLAPNHEIRLDQGMGRSAYLCANANCLNQANLKNLLSRALRVKVPEYIYQNLQERLNDV